MATYLCLSPEIDRVLARLDTSDPDMCWIWPGATNPDGYGLILRQGRACRTTVHRVVYEHFVGPTDGLVLDHTCLVRPCANWRHLEAVTNGENVLRGNSIPAQNARKTHCKYGHEFTPENTYIHSGQRKCRSCRAARQVRRRALREP